MTESRLILELLFFTQMMWLLSYCVTFLPCALGDICFSMSASLCVVPPTYRASHRPEYS